MASDVGNAYLSVHLWELMHHNSIKTVETPMFRISEQLNYEIIIVSKERIREHGCFLANINFHQAADGAIRNKEC